MIMGLGEGQEKMSKSSPNSAIFMEDSAKDVEKKINKAYCPEMVIEKNPIADYIKYIILPGFDYEFTIVKNLEGGGTENRIYRSNE